MFFFIVIIAVVVNNNDYEKEINIPVVQLGVPDRYKMESLMVSSVDSYNAGRQQYDVVNGELIVKVPAFGAGIYRMVVN